MQSAISNRDKLREKLLLAFDKVNFGDRWLAKITRDFHREISNSWSIRKLCSRRRRIDNTYALRSRTESSLSSVKIFTSR
jgi:hypothetical protein